MNEQKTQEIEKMKKLFKDNEQFSKKGVDYHRFVIQKVDLPKELGKQYLNILYDDDNVPHVVLNVNLGLSEKEKERRKQIRKDKFGKRRQEIVKHRQAIREIRNKIRDNQKNMKFDICQELKKELDVLEIEYKEKFARKKRV